MYNTPNMLDRVYSTSAFYKSYQQDKKDLLPFRAAYIMPTGYGYASSSFGAVDITDRQFFQGSQEDFGDNEYFLNEAKSFVVNGPTVLKDGDRGAVQLTTGHFFGVVERAEVDGREYWVGIGARVDLNATGTFTPTGGGQFTIVGDGPMWSSNGQKVMLLERARNDQNFVFVKVPSQPIEGRVGEKPGFARCKLVRLTVGPYGPLSRYTTLFLETEADVDVYNWCKNQVGLNPDNYLMCARLHGLWIVVAEDCFSDGNSEPVSPIFGGILGAPIISSKKQVSQRHSTSLKENYKLNQDRLNNQSSSGLYSQISVKTEGVERSPKSSFDRKEQARVAAMGNNDFFARDTNSLTVAVGRRFTFTPAIKRKHGRKQGPFSFSITGRLPDGLSFDKKTGTIRGTLVSEIYNFTTSITATDPFNRSDSTRIIIGSKTDGLRVTPPTNLSLTVGVAATKTWTATGGVEPYTFTIDNTPAGMSFNTRTGVLSGTPSGAGSTSCTVSVTSVAQNQAYSGKTISADAVNLVALA